MSACWVLVHLVASLPPTTAVAPGAKPIVRPAAVKDRVMSINRDIGFLIGEVTPAERATYGHAGAFVRAASGSGVAVRETREQILNAPCHERPTR